MCIKYRDIAINNQDKIFLRISNDFQPIGKDLWLFSIFFSDHPV